MKKKLYEDLRDPSYAAEYVNEALLEGDEVVFKTAVATAPTAWTFGLSSLCFSYARLESNRTHGAPRFSNGTA
jgi:hypothetical protein